MLTTCFVACCTAVTAIAVVGRGSPDCITQVGVLIGVAVSVATFIKSHFERIDIKADIKDNTDKTIAYGTETVKAANGLSDKRVAEAKAAGVTEGKASVIAAVANTSAPEAIKEAVKTLIP